MISPSTPRIAPLHPPYAPETEAMLKKWMPPGAAVEPLVLFRTLAVHPELMSRMRPLGSGLLGHGLLSAHEREVVIARACARAGSEYEWGVHAVAFAKAAGLSREQLASTAVGAPTDAVWSERDALLLRLVDELHEAATVTEGLWAELSARWTPPELLELLVIAGWYRLLSGVINAVALPLEPWGARFPAP